MKVNFSKIIYVVKNYDIVVCINIKKIFTFSHGQNHKNQFVIINTFDSKMKYDRKFKPVNKTDRVYISDSLQKPSVSVTSVQQKDIFRKADFLHEIALKNYFFLLIILKPLGTSVLGQIFPEPTISGSFSYKKQKLIVKNLLKLCFSAIYLWIGQRR